MALATAGGLQEELYQVADFNILAYQRFNRPGDLLTIYLEGDGKAWRNRRTVASDPTPSDPMGLRLAAQDSSANVLYLARPCQFLSAAACQPALWSSHRYSEPILQALGQAIDQAKNSSQTSRLRLVGFSGGGTIAALLAARRDDICQLITVAANLDIEGWARHHGASPLFGSLSPMNSTQQLQTVSQYHLAGAEDSVVPPAIIEAYLAKLAQPDEAQIVVLPGMGHHSDWPSLWPELLERASWPANCRQTE